MAAAGDMPDGAGGSRPVPEVSVVLCTRNRADQLAHALESLVRQNAPPESFEVLLVDNASTDATRAVAARFAKELFLTYMLEERLGLCVARNVGWPAARAPVVAFFDDDAVARPEWISSIRQAFVTPGRLPGVVGGPVAPIWRAPRPGWLPDTVASALTIVDWGTEPKRLEHLDKEWLVGANMALPKKVLAEVGGFEPGLDRVGMNLLSSGDVFLQKRVLACGYACWYDPRMAIEHVVPPTRLRQTWFLRRFYWQGISDAVMYLIEGKPTMRQRLRGALLRIGRLRGRGLKRLLLPASTPEAFEQKCFALIDLGFAAGLLGAARR